MLCCYLIMPVLSFYHLYLNQSYEFCQNQLCHFECGSTDKLSENIVWANMKNMHQDELLI